MCAQTLRSGGGGRAMQSLRNGLQTNQWVQRLGIDPHDRGSGSDGEKSDIFYPQPEGKTEKKRLFCKFVIRGLFNQKQASFNEKKENSQINQTLKKKSVRG